ncbi:hypothetical protein EON76_03295 [bacterium]|nr:MAG: hypothetical protein EON76_03295 [bacterium]
MENLMEPSVQPAPQDQFIEMRSNTLIQVILLGIILGAVSWLLTLLLDRFVMTALFCGNDASSALCTGSTAIAGNIALVFASIGGLLGLVRLGVYRPLLVAIAAAICLWGLAGWVDGLMWYEALAWTVILYSLTFTAFSWLVRPRLFLIAIVLIIVVVLLARILPVLR